MYFCIYKLSENESYLIFIDFLYWLSIGYPRVSTGAEGRLHWLHGHWQQGTSPSRIGDKFMVKTLDKLNNSNWKWMVSPGKLMKS